jgi:hypothetical protein
MPIESDIIVVSGLPRSGTSLMMQMLDRGGIAIVSDHIRAPDTDNPRGYYEYEPVKTIGRDTSWLPATRGKAFKMVSLLLERLPPTETYRIIFMERDLHEVLASQEQMLQRLQRPTAPSRDELKRSFELHLTRLNRWLARQSNTTVLRVPYRELIEDPAGHAARVNAFLDGTCNVDGMCDAIDPALYRNRLARTPSA